MVKRSIHTCSLCRQIWCMCILVGGGGGGGGGMRNMVYAVLYCTVCVSTGGKCVHEIVCMCAGMSVGEGRHITL